MEQAAFAVDAAKLFAAEVPPRSQPPEEPSQARTKHETTTQQAGTYGEEGGFHSPADRGSSVDVRIWEGRKFGLQGRFSL